MTFFSSAINEYNQQRLLQQNGINREISRAPEIALTSTQKIYKAEITPGQQDILERRHSNFLAPHRYPHYSQPRLPAKIFSDSQKQQMNTLLMQSELDQDSFQLALEQADPNLLEAVVQFQQGRSRKNLTNKTNQIQAKRLVGNYHLKPLYSPNLNRTPLEESNALKTMDYYGVTPQVIKYSENILQNHRNANPLFSQMSEGPMYLPDPQSLAPGEKTEPNFRYQPFHWLCSGQEKISGAPGALPENMISHLNNILTQEKKGELSEPLTAAQATLAKGLISRLSQALIYILREQEQLLISNRSTLRNWQPGIETPEQAQVEILQKHDKYIKSFKA